MNAPNTDSSKADQPVSPETAPWRPEAIAEELFKLRRRGVWTHERYE